MSVAGWVNDDERGGWVHCDRPGWLNDDGVTCSKCQASFTWDERPEWVVLSITEDVSARVDGQTYVVPLDALGAIERRLLDECEAFGWYSPEAADVARRVGVPMSEMVDAWQRLRGSAGAGAVVARFDLLGLPDELPELEDHDRRGLFRDVRALVRYGVGILDDLLAGTYSLETAAADFDYWEDGSLGIGRYLSELAERAYDDDDVEVEA